MPALLTLIGIVVILGYHRASEAKRYKANIVEAPSSYGYPQQFGNSGLGSPLTLKRNPAPFFGSGSLMPLSRKCFTLEKNLYEWRLCPFHNATQTETGTSRWNPYRGVLGIWAEWKIDVKSNALVSMSMTDGDDCGTHGLRKVDVKPVCGVKESLTSVEEPSTCHYVMNLEAPVFCQSTNLLVYPCLDSKFKTLWDEAYTEWQDGILTKKGYLHAVSSLLADAGVISVSSRSPPSTSSPTQTPPTGAASDPRPDSKESVSSNANYQELMERYERLGRQHAETILELANCRRDLRQRSGASNAANP